MRNVLAMIAVMGFATPASADDARLVAARIAYDNLEQGHVLELLAPALAGSLADHDRASALRLAGCAHMVLGDRPAAVASFRASFAIEPDAALEPQIASPDARSLFEIARGEWRAGLVPVMEAHATELARLRLAVRAPTTARGGEPLAIGIELVDPAKLVARVELSFRRRGQSEFTAMTARPTAAGALGFEIAPTVTSSPRDYTFEYHVTLRHQSGFDLRRDGDADHPHVIAIAAGHPPRWYEQWWVRGAIAVGVVGLAAGGYLAYRSIDVGPQDVVSR
ncbi:MAG: hypothetical protein ABI678_21925 [Kofleriaceae bacterium]